jgi:hypothetical protein
MVGAAGVSDADGEGEGRGVLVAIAVLVEVAGGLVTGGVTPLQAVTVRARTALASVRRSIRLRPGDLRQGTAAHRRISPFR